MRVEKPEVNPRTNGEVMCHHCPFEPSYPTSCQKWFNRNGAVKTAKEKVCPTAETYAEACRLAEQAEKGEKE